MTRGKTQSGTTCVRRPPAAYAAVLALVALLALAAAPRGDAAVTTALEPWRTSVKIEPKALSIESVRT